MPHLFTPKEKKKLRLRLINSALTGLLANPCDGSSLRRINETCVEAVARLAVEQSDAVIEFLDKKP